MPREQLSMCEKYSINLIPPAQEKQNPIQKSQEEESIRMANAEGSSSICNPNTQGSHPRNLSHLRPSSLGASATGHSSGACNGPGALTHTLGPAEGHPCRPSESSPKCPAIALQFPINANSMSSYSLQNQNLYLALFMSNLVGKPPHGQLKCCEHTQ